MPKSCDLLWPAIDAKNPECLFTEECQLLGHFAQKYVLNVATSYFFLFFIEDNATN